MTLHERLLRLFLDSQKVAALLGDLDEEAARLGASQGWVRRQALRCALSAAWLAATRTTVNRAVANEQRQSGVAVSVMAILTQDVRYALRHIRRQPAFTAVVLLILSVGVGTSTAVFSVVKAVLLEPLPYPNSEQLVRIVETVPADETVRGVPEERTLMDEHQFFRWRGVTRTLSQMAVYVASPTTITTADGAARSESARVSPAVFSMLGARTTRGRLLLDSDERTDARVVVISADA